MILPPLAQTNINLHTNAKTVFVTPYLSESFSKLKYAKVNFDHIVFPDIENTPKKFAILSRNKWIVDNADLIFALIKRNFGGAFKAYSYAKSKHKNIINLADKLNITALV